MKKLDYKHTRLACYVGYITQAIINNFTPLLFVTFNSEYGVSLKKLSVLITANFAFQLFIDLASARFVDKIGYKTAIVGAHVCAAAGLASLGILPFIIDPFAGLIIATILNGIGGGLMEVLVSPIVEGCPTEKKAASMSLLHSFYCWGQVGVVLMSTLFFIAFGLKNWRILAFVWAAIPALNAILFSKVPINQPVEAHEAMSLKSLFTSKVFLLFCLLMLCAGAAELSMSQWASAFAETGLKVSKTVGDLLGPCLFAVLMGLARVLYAKVSEKNLITFIMGSCVLCVAGYMTAVLSPNPAAALIGCEIVGLSVGIMWPGVYSAGITALPKGGTAMYALFALSGDLGCCFGPAGVGVISDLTGGNMKTGLACASVFPFVLLLGAASVLRKQRKGTLTGD